MQPEWEIWIDVNISPAIAKWIRDETGIQTKSAYTLELYTLPDIEIYRKAKEYGNVILISKDADFPELISKQGAPPKLINIKIGNCNNQTLWELLKPHINKAINLLITDNIDIVEIDSVTR
ncbi:DUF5615 family PIN-like protein [Chitinophaga cymbidii]|uniref:DUF5615 domain-containing protein n=1 Tax=Chitinophaga cymbidii TaxID=1096750 RepID=A0A512RFE8_9BACT|nr:DUF5615 family PIN-like protein [Chitinophaga cymbidii]GEP94430.1 hypothetical protein CCY01nite_06900 [Chitinophaga cymbidii]